MENELLQEINKAFNVKYPTYGYLFIAPTPKEAKQFKHIFITSGENRVRINSLKSYELIFNMLCKKSWYKSLGNKGDIPYLEPVADLIDSKMIKSIDLRNLLKFFRNDPNLYFDTCYPPQRILKELVKNGKVIAPTFPAIENITDLTCYFYEINWENKIKPTQINIEIIAQYKDLQLAKTGELLENNETKTKFKTTTSDQYKLLKGLMLQHQKQGETTWISEEDLLEYVNRNNIKKTYENLNNNYLKIIKYRITNKESCYKLALN